MSDFFALVFVVFFIFVLCSLCGFCCRRKEQGAIYSTPVVVTATEYQPPGGASYPIQAQQTIIPSSNVGMPMPYPAQTSPYPVSYGGGAPYPTPGAQAPYPMPGGQAPYPPMNAAPYPQNPSPYPTNASAPYPMNPAMQNPPSYHDVMGPGPGNFNYASAPPTAPPGSEKQMPYNPGYSG